MFFCGHELVWNCNESLQDMSDDYIEDPEATFRMHTCSHCGRTYEISDPIKEERETMYADYWKGDD